MPILDIEMVENPNIPKLANVLADIGGQILGTGPRRTWVRLRYIDKANYAENGAPDESVPTSEGKAVRPVFISVLMSKWPQPIDRQQIAMALAERFGVVLNRPKENVHICFQPEAQGRIAFGGVLSL